MVDLWTNQNAEKQYEKSLAAERKASDLRNIELEKEKLEIERELENRKRIEKQNILKAELQQQIQELSKSFFLCTTVTRRRVPNSDGVSHAEFEPNHHREDTHHFILLEITRYCL